MHIVILGGAGLMGSGTVRDLLSELSGGVTRLVIADTSPDNYPGPVATHYPVKGLARGRVNCVQSVPTNACTRMPTNIEFVPHLRSPRLSGRASS